MQDANYWATRPLDDPKTDWESGDTWIEAYQQSVKHPHRAWLLGHLDKLVPRTVLEVGCNVGPNLRLMLDSWPHLRFAAGIDPSPDAIAAAKEFVPDAYFGVGTATKLPNISVDLVLADAALMYVPPEEIETAMDEFARVSKRYIAILDWHSDSLLGEEQDYHWARDYEALLRARGFEVAEYPVTEDVWPSPNWVKNGRLTIATRT